MNILPHKSWHVRTKKNIARVRKDEAQAAEEEKERQRRIALAAQEARTSFLRDRASQRCQDIATESLPPSLPVEEVADIIQKDGHVNFFQDIEEGIQQKGKTNKEHEEEKKREQDDYEKKIGYLTYLGQNSIEQTKERPWYEKIDRSIAKESTKSGKSAIATSKNNYNSSQTMPSTKNDDPTAALKDTKFKDFHDPLKDIRKYLATPGVKAKIDKTLAKTASLKRPREEVGTSGVEIQSQPSKKLKKSKSKKVKHKKSKKSKRKHHHKSKSKHEMKDKNRKKHRQGKDKRSKRSSSRSCSSRSEGSDSDWETEEDSDKEEQLKKVKLAALRAERLEREREEGRKAEILMAKFRGEVVEEEKPPEDMRQVHPSGVKQKYNAQFNPHLARQNFDH